MKILFDYVFQKAPWIVRWMFYLWFAIGGVLVATFTLGWNALPVVNAHIVGVVETWAEPRVLKRDAEISTMNVKLDSIARYQNDQGQDIRDIRNVIMKENEK